MKIFIVKNAKKIGELASKIILDELKLKFNLIIGLATGETPLGLYSEMINSEQDFSKVTTFNLDEYYSIESDNLQSYSYFMHKNLFDKLKFGEINLLDGSAKHPLEECKKYEAKIDKKKIDIQILGIGSNGHIGFNEPGSNMDSKTRVVKLSPSTIKDNSRLFNSEKEVPKQALTMGISTILKSKKIILLAIGKNKAEAINNMVNGVVDSNCPASFLQKHKDVIVVLDKDAAKEL
jgi:glucosamine-6-phosphate deaminase